MEKGTDYEEKLFQNHIDQVETGDIEYDVLKVAADQIRETEIKTILVDNCQDCPIVLTDDYYGYNGCALIEIKLVGPEEMPDNKVHDECPLKNMNYRIRLK